MSDMPERIWAIKSYKWGATGLFGGTEYNRADLAQPTDDARAKALEWQPIETAPKDGAYILLGDTEGTMMVGFWNGCYWDDGDFLSAMAWPTHWMPLPLPPKGDE